MILLDFNMSNKNTKGKQNNNSFSTWGGNTSSWNTNNSNKQGGNTSPWNTNNSNNNKSSTGFGGFGTGTGTGFGGFGTGTGTGFGGFKTGTGTGSGWNSGTTGTGWGGNSQPQQQGFNQMQPSAPVIPPGGCTVGYILNEGNAPKVELKVNTNDPNAPKSAEFRVNHISQIPAYGLYTIDELRYYDYLYEEYITKVSTPTTQNNMFNNQNNQNKQFSFNNNGQAPKPVYVSCWKKKPEEIKEPQEPLQKQPFGALPATTISVSQAEGESLPKQEQIPEDPGFRNSMSLYQHILKTNPEKSATPGLRQLNPQKLQDRPSVKDKSKSAQSNSSIRPGELFKNFDESSEEKEDIKNDDYEYIPDLDSIKDNEEIYNFTVIHHKFGSIVFPRSFKVKQINPKKSIIFSDRKVSISISNVDKRRLGLDKNFISIVTLKNVLPSEYKKKESLRHYQADLMKYCKDHGYDFISYTKEDGSLMFTVSSLSEFPVEIL